MKVPRTWWLLACVCIGVVSAVVWWVATSYSTTRANAGADDFLQAPTSPVVATPPQSAPDTVHVYGGKQIDAGREAGPIQRDPTKPDYDAARLYGTSWSDAAGIFQAEPRREPWASHRERDVYEAIADDLRTVDRDAEIEVTCHTSTCAVRITSSSRMLVEELNQYPLVCISSFVEPDFHPEAGYVEHHVIFGGENLSSDGFQRQRQRECAKWRDAFVKRRDMFHQTGRLD